MILGHFGFGLGAKKFAPKISLGTLFMAVQWADLLWPVLLLLNVEQVKTRTNNPKFPFEFTSYPITHSLLMGLVWGACFGFLYWLVKKDVKSSIVLGICVVSHWFLDLIVHEPDLPLIPGAGVKVGLGLWEWPLLTALLEVTIFSIGLFLYLKTTRARNNTGKWSLWLLVALLLLNQVASKYSPMPSSAHALGWAAQYQWIFILMGYWVDRNRDSAVISPAPISF